MDMPIALRRMLESACVNDQLKNWSIYEEKDGVYTFKIRFVSQEKGHVESSATSVMENTQSVNRCAFKQKNSRQLERDSERNKAWIQRRMDKRVTRSMAKEQANSQVVDQGPTQSAGQLSSRINPDSPVENFRRSVSCSSHDSPNPGINTFEETFREEYDLVRAAFPSSDDECDEIDDDFRHPGNCHPSCCFSAECDGNQNVYRCLKCSDMNRRPPSILEICQLCLDAGGHAPHRKYLQLVISQE